MYGYEFSATLTTDRLRYKLKTRPLVREGTLRQRAKEMEKKILVMGLKGVPDTKMYRPTDHRSQDQLNST
jgi:hypothetical protein